MWKASAHQAHAGTARKYVPLNEVHASTSGSAFVAALVELQLCVHALVGLQA